MGALDWLLRLLRPRPPRRDVARLAGPGADLDEVVETVDLTGGPLKPEHRRRALRDGRLLPKAKPLVTLRRRRPHFFTRQEASRLFAGTLRTRDRSIRDLLTDEEQLERLGLPVWRDEGELAAALGLSVGLLRHYSIHRCRERVTHYVTFEIPKRSGGRRLIMAPKRRLKAIQRRLLMELVDRLPVSEHAHGFRHGRSIRTGAQPHVGRSVLLHLDLADFFPTVHFGRVRGLLVAYGYSYPVATSLAVLMTESPRQPVEVDGTLFHVPVGPRHCVQGAPTSPGLCNAIALRLDRRLAGLARRFGATYTRYADDLTFSLDGDGKDVHALRTLAERIIRAEGFAPNHAKTRIERRGQAQTVTGVTVNACLGLSRQTRRRLRAQAHRLCRELAKGSADPAELPVLQGRLAYLHMLNPAQAESLRARWVAQGGPWPLPRVRVPRRATPAPQAARGPVTTATAGPVGPLRSRRSFEFQQGSSDKFWVIELGETWFTTRWGRRGTQGQSKTKEFASAAEAQKAHDRIVAEKLREGYLETTAS